MSFIKKYLKFIIGIAALILVFAVFAMSQQRVGSLETGTLKDWRAAPLERRVASAKILSGSDEHAELITQCIDKIATLPDSAEMMVKDAASLCYTGIQLKENL